MQTSRLFKSKSACSTQQCTYVVGARASSIQAYSTVRMCVCKHMCACTHTQPQTAQTTGSFGPPFPLIARTFHRSRFRVACAKRGRVSARGLPIHKVPPGSLLQRRGARDGRGCEWIAQLSARQRKGGEQKKKKRRRGRNGRV